MGTWVVFTVLLVTSSFLLVFGDEQPSATTARPIADDTEEQEHAGDSRTGTDHSEQEKLIPETEIPPKPSWPSDKPNEAVVGDHQNENSQSGDRSGGPAENDRGDEDTEDIRQMAHAPSVVATIVQEVDLDEALRGSMLLDESEDEGDDDDEDADEEDDADEEAETGSTPEEELYQPTSPPPPRPKTAEEKLADDLYTQGEALMNRSHGVGPTATALTRKAYKLFEDAAAHGHVKAGELVGFAFLFGDNLPWNPRKAREIFEALSVKGSPRGQVGLGFMYTAGITVNSSQAKALVYFTFASLGGDPWGQMALGYRYWSGVNLAQSCEAALTYYRKVAEKVANEVSVSGGNAVARIRLAEEAEGGSSNSALMDNDLLQYYRFLADKGDVQAQVGLGQLYLTGGRGLEQNGDQAFHYFSTAAEAGNANAHAYLGKMYLEGSPNIKADNRTAFEYFKKAADKGNPVGQSGLGLMYLYGRGVEQDYQKAIKYFQLAADQGWVDGQLQLGTMYFSGLGVRRDYKLATKYFQLASQSGHVLAFYNLAQMHATGMGMMRNCHTATELYKNVGERARWSEMLMQAHSQYREGNVNQAALKYLFLAELGYEVAQSNIAYLLDTGQATMFDKSEVYPRALIHWERAAEQGSSLARIKLGDYHYYGRGTTVDFAAAAHQYKIASDQQNNAQAMFNLAYMHEQGLGVKRDIHLAKRFYDLAAETSSEAQVPVSLALAKLGLLFGLHYIQKGDWWTLKDIDKVLGSDWDIYLIAGLCVVLVSLLYFRNLR